MGVSQSMSKRIMNSRKEIRTAAKRRRKGIKHKLRSTKKYKR